MLRSVSESPGDVRQEIRATIVEAPMRPSLVVTNAVIVAVFSLIIFSSISFTEPVWTLNLTEIHVMMLFSIPLLLFVGFYIKSNSTKHNQIVEPAKRNIDLGAQSLTRSIEATDAALESVEAQASLLKDILTANMFPTSKTEVGAYNKRLQESTELLKKLIIAVKELRENRQVLERQRQQLLSLRRQT